MAAKQSLEERERIKAVSASYRAKLRGKFLQQGISSFEKHEILELLLIYAIPKTNNEELCHTLIEHFGSLSAVFDARVEDLCSIEGINKNTAVLIKLVPSLARIYIKDKTCSHIQYVENLDDMITYVKAKFIGVQEERVYGIMLDDEQSIVGDCMFAKGGFDSVSFPIEMVIQEILRYKASDIILTHNHPHGTSPPSTNDCIITQNLEKKLQSMNVGILEHIIVGKDEHDVSCLYKQGYVERSRDTVIYLDK